MRSSRRRPLLLIVIGIVGWAYGPAAAEGKVAGQISSVVGPQVAEALQGLAASAKDSGKGATFVGLATLLIGASGVFGQLKDALNTIWEVRQKKGGGILGFLRQRFLTFGMVLAIGFLLLVSLVIATVVSRFGGMLESQFGVPHIVSQLVGFVLPLIIETLLFAMMFKFLPDAKIPWSSVWVGAIFTAVLFEIGKLGLTWYPQHHQHCIQFRRSGICSLLLLWVYYSSLILFFGAEFTEVYSRRLGHEILPGKHGEAVRTCEREERGCGPKAGGVKSPRGTGVAAVKAELHPLADRGESAKPPGQGVRCPVDGADHQGLFAAGTGAVSPPSIAYEGICGQFAPAPVCRTRCRSGSRTGVGLDLAVHGPAPRFGGRGTLPSGAKSSSRGWSDCCGKGGTANEERSDRQALRCRRSAFPPPSLK